MRKTITLFLVSLFLLLSCMDRERCYTYHYVAGFPENFHEPAEYAAAHWTQFSGIPVTIENGNPSDLACGLRLMSKNTSEYVGLKLDTHTDFFGIHRGDDGSIALVTDAWPDPNDQARARSILMHEIGHEFRMEHVLDLDAVMGIGFDPKTGDPFTRFEPHTDYNGTDFAECVRVSTCYKNRPYSGFDGGGP